MDKSWEAIFEAYRISEHDFDKTPFAITNKQINAATSHFKNTSEKEVRILCKQDNREDRPQVFRQMGLFILPTKNGQYSIVKGEGYIDIPPITSQLKIYNSKLDFELKSSQVGNSEMQHIDYAYASSLIRTLIGDQSLVLTIRGRKFTPKFTFRVGKHSISVESVQTEVDAGYEGRNQIVLIEGKSASATNVIIRQMYYPLRQWADATQKPVQTLFFARNGGEYHVWQFRFTDSNDYNSIELVKSERFSIESSY